ncbi:hypothetical protein Q7C36_000158 [Tachysurus vachellii]|uniref:Uncharacterized protein n=1 Tax=Tachysurus vachellii TaxID=175792 RepID=A0AA88P0R2_TACVA|nr:hypothetical protein Q7C36_000158 [Tachysurus vachellii]
MRFISSHFYLSWFAAFEHTLEKHSLLDNGFFLDCYLSVPLQSPGALLPRSEASSFSPRCRRPPRPMED